MSVWNWKSRWHLKASPFTLQTDASFLRTSDTTSLCRSNFGFSFSMCTLYSSVSTALKIPVCKENTTSVSRGSTWRLVSARASCDRKTAVTLGSLTGMRIHMTHLTHFLVWLQERLFKCGNIKLSLLMLLPPLEASREIGCHRPMRASVQRVGISHRPAEWLSLPAQQLGRGSQWFISGRILTVAEFIELEAS